MRLAWLMCAPLLLTLLAGPVWARPGLTLQIWTGEPERLVLCLETWPGQTFSLEHMNSIYDAPVRETYLIGPGEGLIQVSLESPSAGVFEYHGYDPPPAGKVVLDRPLGAIRLLSFGYEHHKLSMGGRTFGLAQWAEPGRPVIVKVVDPANSSSSGKP